MDYKKEIIEMIENTENEGKFKICLYDSYQISKIKEARGLTLAPFV